MVYRMMQSEWLKMRRTPFYYMHLLLPILFAVLMNLIFYRSAKTANEVLGVSLQFILSVFPLVVGIVASLVMEQEQKAGHYKEMISFSYGRKAAIAVKSLFLFGMGILAYTGAMLLLSLIYQAIHKEALFSVKDFLILLVLAFLPMLIIYLFHMFLSLLFGFGASIGVGLFETLIALLFITGEGDLLWFFFPCSMPSHLCGLWLGKNNEVIAPIFSNNFNRGLICCMLYLIGMTVLLVLFFSRSDTFHRD